MDAITKDARRWRFPIRLPSSAEQATCCDYRTNVRKSRSNRSLDIRGTAGTKCRVLSHLQEAGISVYRSTTPENRIPVVFDGIICPAGYQLRDLCPPVHRGSEDQSISRIFRFSPRTRYSLNTVQLELANVKMHGIWEGMCLLPNSW